MRKLIVRFGVVGIIITLLMSSTFVFADPVDPNPQKTPVETELTNGE
jgi:hypothetical protein